MRRPIPFLLTTVLVLLSIGLLTAYRSGLFSKLGAFDCREGCAAACGGSAETADPAAAAE